MARVVALPSISEGVPTVVLEAMAASRPVVAMRVGHIGHVMTDGSEGFLALPGDLNGFAVRLVTLLEHPELALRMGAAGRTRADDARRARGRERPAARAAARRDRAATGGGMSRLDPFWLRVYRDVGADRYLPHAELPVEAAATTRTIWEIYDRLFGRFTGAGLDPLFNRFTHPPARRLAPPAFPRGVPVVIVGAGPSLDSSVDDLHRIRDRVIVASSWRGALALQMHGLYADSSSSNSRTCSTRRRPPTIAASASPRVCTG